MEQSNEEKSGKDENWEGNSHCVYCVHHITSLDYVHQWESEYVGYYNYKEVTVMRSLK